MTTPRIEENGDISDVCLKLGKAVDGKPFINIIEWGAVLREAKANWEAKAYQAGRDEAVEKWEQFIEEIPEAYGWGKEDEEKDKGYQICSKNVKAMGRKAIKSLQDKK